MKRTLALTLLAGCATLANAQSSVTVFGIVDLNVRNVKNGSAGDVTSISPLGLRANQIGFRGIEDLGGGLWAGFWLESWVFANTGTNTTANGKFFDRKSTVSLGGKFGEIRLGRDYTPTYTNNAVFDPFGNVGLAGQINVISTLGSGATTLVRADNTVGYFLPPNLGGFSGTVQVSAAEGVPTNKYRGARLAYANGPLVAAAATGSTDTTTANKYKLSNAGISYQFPGVKVMGHISLARFGALKQTVWTVGGSIPIGAGEIRLAYSNSDMSGGSGAFADDADSKYIGLGYSYNLSKRTALYTTFGHIKNKGAAKMVVAGLPSTAAMKGGETSRGFDFGISHSF